MTDYKDTVGFMLSSDYKDRFKAEYYQTKIRYEKLKRFNTELEARRMTEVALPENRKHDCPDHFLRQQQGVMGEYLHILEVRAVIEGIEL